MRSRKLLTALLLALCISTMFTLWLSRRLPKARVVVAAAKPKYVVAARDLVAGEPLQHDMLRLAEWDGTALPGAFAQSSDAVGRTVLYPLAAGQPILPTQVADAAAGAGLAFRIPSGMRAVSVKANDIADISGFLLPGTRVDAYATRRSGKQQESQTTALLEDVQVLAAGQKIEPDPQGKPVAAGVVTLLVTPEQAQRVVEASATGEVCFALRNGGDRGHLSIVARQPARSVAAGSQVRKPQGNASNDGSTAPQAEAYQVEMVNGDKQHTEKF